MNKAVLFFKGILIGAGFLLLVIGVGGFLYTATHPEIADKLPGATMPAFGLVIFLGLVAFGFLIPSRKLVKALQIINAILLIFVVILSIDGMFKDAAYLNDRATGELGAKESDRTRSNAFTFARVWWDIFEKTASICQAENNNWWLDRGYELENPGRQTWTVTCENEEITRTYDVTFTLNDYEVIEVTE